jgi:MscS family membrane protein
VWSYRSRNGVCFFVVLVLLFFYSTGWGRSSAQELLPHAKAVAGKKRTAQTPVQTPVPDSAAQATPETVPPPPPPPVDPLGRSNPHDCVLGFLRAAETKDYERAAQYLDGKRTPARAQELAIQLKFLLDQGLSTSIANLSRSANGNAKDGLRVTHEDVGTVKTPAGDLKVMLDRVERSGEPAIWLFSQETLNQVPAAFASAHHTDYEQYFPQWMHVSFMSVPLWRWAFILLSLLAMFVAASLLTRSLLWLSQRIFKTRFTPGVEDSVLALKAPIFWLTLAILLGVAGEYAITALGRHYWKTTAYVLVWVSIAWLVIRLTDIVVNFARHRLLLRMQVERATFLSMLGRLFKILVVLILAIALLTHAGVNVSGLIAGLGIGGIALALAAQKTLADLFGGLSIVMRGAVRVGDFCQVDGIMGTVEDIGISALNLRTLDRSVVSIPNSKVAAVNFENFQLRDRFWLHQVFTLRSDTPHDVLKTVLDNIRELLMSRAEIDKDSARVRLIKLTTAGPQIEVFAYLHLVDKGWPVFLARQEEIILGMMALVEEAGTSFVPLVDVLRTDSDKGKLSAMPRS